MADVPDYVVQGTRPDVVVNKQGVPTRGVTVTVWLPAYDETHEVFVESMDTAKVKTAIEKLVNNRNALAKLGQG
jgi:hypothetical protein